MGKLRTVFCIIKDPDQPDTYALFEKNNDLTELKAYASFCGIAPHEIRHNKISYYILTERQKRFAVFCGAVEIQDIKYSVKEIMSNKELLNG